MQDDCHQRWPGRHGRLEFAARLSALLEEVGSRDPEARASLVRVIKSVRSDMRPSVEDVSAVLVVLVGSLDVGREARSQSEVGEIGTRPLASENKPVQGKKKDRVGSTRPRSVFGDRIREDESDQSDRSNVIRKKLRLGARSVLMDASGRRRLKDED